MDADRFVITERDPETIKDVTCAICHRVAARPTNCRDDHVFCYSCIHSQLETYLACPVDGATLNPSDLVINKFMERTVLRLTIRCENRDSGGANAMVGAIRKRLRHPVGCRWEGTVRELQEHKSVCRFRCVRCRSCNRSDIPVIGMTAHLRECAERYTRCDMCQKEVIQRAMPDHIEVCPEASVYCPNHCLLRPAETTDVRMLQRKHVKEHLTTCPAQVIECEFRDMGCKLRCRRDVMHKHMEDAIQQHVSAVRSGLVEVRKYLGLKPTVATCDDSQPPSPMPMEADGGAERIEDVWDVQPLSIERRS